MDKLKCVLHSRKEWQMHECDLTRLYMPCHFAEFIRVNCNLDIDIFALIIHVHLENELNHR